MMEAFVSPLVLTKLRPPAARTRIVSRTRLTDLLSRDKSADVLLVCAPAGYGKTTLLTEWAHSLVKNGTAVAWFALDPGDDDPIPFGSYLIASFTQAFGSISGIAQIAQRLRSSPDLDLQKILPDLINALMANGQDCVLILDDYHLIRSPAIHSAIAYLIDHIPGHLRIALGSRSDPPLPLARLRARGRLLEIRTASLRFLVDETAQFLHETMCLPISPQGISALEERTEGWIAGLQLASLALQSPASQSIQPDCGWVNAEQSLIASITGSHRYLVEYLMEEVFNRQPEEVKSFLLSTSILERLNAPLCDAILSAAPQERTMSSEEILQQLEKSNLFIVALDEQRTWYRYHHLFRDFLLTRLNNLQPERIQILHRKASQWLAEHDFLREAAGHAFQIRDWAFAAAFVEQHSFTLIIHSEISTIYEWCSVFPEEVMRTRPMLCMLQGLALAYNFRRKNRERVEARLQQADLLIAALEDRQLAHEILEFGAVVRNFLAMAPDPAVDARKLLSLAQSLLDHYAPGDPGQFSPLLLSGYAQLSLCDTQAAAQALEAARELALRGGLFFGVVESTFHLARLAHSQGQLRRAAEICRQGQADIAALLTHPEQELPALGCLDIALGCVLLEQDQLQEAEQHLRYGLEQMGAGMNPHYLMTAHLALFRMNQILGRHAEAIRHLDRLEAIWPDIAFCTRGLRTTHALRISPDNPDARAEAMEWRLGNLSREDMPLPGLGPLGAAEAYYLADLAWIELQIGLGDAGAAAPYLERQLIFASTHGLLNRVIELSLLEAEIEAINPHGKGNDKPAWIALERALTAAKPEGYVHTFDQRPLLTRLLAEAAHHGIFTSYIGQILAASRWRKSIDSDHRGLKAGAAPVSRMPFAESLSERELEVLRMMAQGATNQAIAERLVITVGTVKSHINHILGKLGAQNRTEAVARAGEAGLL